MTRIRNQHGVALVEFALLLPLVLILVFGVIDFGRMATLNINLNGVVQEGAIYAATNPAFEDHDAIKDRMVNSIQRPALDRSDITITCPSVDGRTLRIQATHTADFITPLFPGSITLQSEVVTDVLTESANCTES